MRRLFMHFIGENWEMIKQTIHTEYDLTNISYNTWIEPLQFYDVKDDTVYIQIPTGQAHASTTSPTSTAIILR